MSPHELELLFQALNLSGARLTPQTLMWLVVVLYLLGERGRRE